MSNQQNEQTVDQLPGEERGMPSVNAVAPSTAKRGLVLMAILLFLCAAGGVGYWKMQSSADKSAADAVQKDLKLTNAVPARTFVAPPALPGPETPPALPGQSVAVPAVSAPPPLPGNSGYASGGYGQNKPAPVLDKSGSSLMIVSDNTPPGQVGAGTTPASGGSSGSIMSELLTATNTPGGNAGMLGNRNFLLAKGSFIDCALQTRLDSTVPGMTSCVITRNIYSDNGKVLLIERGSTVSGEYKANMRQGMARIFVLWSRIKTPNGVVINLDSPGTDPLGGGGVPGHINTHFWKRFGGALMLSLVDDVARGISNNTSSGNNQFNFNSTGDATQDMAAEALKNTINIPPTLYKNQGEQVGIYVARDLDFASVYDVRAN